jgi:hypothetical protein
MSGTVQLQNLPPRTPSVESLVAELEPPHGYPQVATFMGDHPEMAMVRRFRGLNARNLLYLQAELVQIEKELLKCERDDANNKADPYKPYYALDYKILAEQEPRNTQLDLILKMRVKLKEYSMSLSCLFPLWALADLRPRRRCSHPTNHPSKNREPLRVRR